MNIIKVIITPVKVAYSLAEHKVTLDYLLQGDNTNSVHTIILDKEKYIREGLISQWEDVVSLGTESNLKNKFVVTLETADKFISTEMGGGLEMGMAGGELGSLNATITDITIHERVA